MIGFGLTVVTRVFSSDSVTRAPPASSARACCAGCRGLPFPKASTFESIPGPSMGQGNDHAAIAGNCSQSWSGGWAASEHVFCEVGAELKRVVEHAHWTAGELRGEVRGALLGAEPQVDVSGQTAEPPMVGGSQASMVASRQRDAKRHAMRSERTHDSVGACRGQHHPHACRTKLGPADAATTKPGPIGLD